MDLIFDCLWYEPANNSRQSIVVDNSGTLFCLQAVALFKSYFGGAFDEDAIRNNFVLIYELLDGK